MKMIMLKVDAIKHHGFEAAPAGRVPVRGRAVRPETLSVQVEDLSADDYLNAQRDPGVLAMAPPMPLQLIRPLTDSSSMDGANTDEDGATWGVRAVGAIESPFTGDGTTVAVLDTGIDRNHSAFQGEGLEIVERNFTDEEPADTDGHGTHCAGTIFGRNVGSLRIGVAPGVKKALIGKVLGEGGNSTDVLASAIHWATENGADIISMSLGMDFPGYQVYLTEKQGLPADLATSMALRGYMDNIRLFDSLGELLLRQADFGKGALVIAAAGNESKRDINPDYQISAAPPAAAEDFLSVAAVGRTEDPSKPYRIADFSNTNARVAAPGVGIKSARANGDLISLSGTSMATPHVAGVAALWAQQIRQEEEYRLRTLLLRLEGSGRRTNGLDPRDVGVGVVYAPA